MNWLVYGSRIVLVGVMLFATAAVASALTVRVERRPGAGLWIIIDSRRPAS